MCVWISLFFESKKQINIVEYRKSKNKNIYTQTNNLNKLIKKKKKKKKLTKRRLKSKNPMNREFLAI